MTYAIVVIGYVLILLGISVYKSRTVKSADDFIVARRHDVATVRREQNILDFHHMSAGVEYQLRRRGHGL